MGRFQTGDIVGNHQIISAFAPGGFGEAYLARNVVLDRLEVLKCVRADLEELHGATPRLTKDIKKRFWTEAKAQARLNNEHICTIFHLYERDRVIVMELIDGQPLAELINRRTGVELLDIGIMIADAIAYAHAKSVLHRDLTPRNIMLTQAGRIKVLDFGLAKLMEEESTPDSKFYVMGTEPYMSPEQQHSLANTTEQSDIFSLGAILYHLYTGRKPYFRRFKEDWCQKPARFSEIHGVEQWETLERALVTALEAEPQDRQPTMMDFRRELAAIREALALADDRKLNFFSASTLFEVVRPSHPEGDTPEKKLAQDQLVANQVENCAMTSPSVLGEVIERISELHFEGTDPGLANRVAQGVLTRAKQRIAMSRGAKQNRRSVRWDNLTPQEKRLFQERAGGLIFPAIEAISGFARVPADDAIFISKFGNLCEYDLEVSDYQLLAEAQSMNAASVFAQEQRYQKGPYKRILKVVGPNRYEFISTETDWGSPARRRPRKPRGKKLPGQAGIGDDAPTVAMK